MTPEIPARQRVVEVIAELGEGHAPRWRYGSGLLIGGRQVLTSAHVVVDAVDVTVRRPDKSSMPAVLRTALIGTADARKLDLALLEVPEADELPHLPVALVNRDVATGVFVENCAAVGYPSFVERPHEAGRGSIRETAQVRGYIAPLSGLVEDLLSLEVTATPRELPPAGLTLAESEWSGMSGAAVLTPDPRGGPDEVLLGVVAEHSPRRGPSQITILPLGRLLDEAAAPANVAEWWARLGVADPSQLPRLPTGESRSRARLHDVPDLPPHYLPRVEATAALKAALMSGPNVRVGLHGMGGTGKSVVAAAVARDADVQRAFPDGVIWVSVGQNPDAATIQLRQAQVVDALNEPPFGVADVEQRKTRLGRLFENRRCLLILDDVWRGADVGAFGTPGPRCRVLITTRDRALITNLGALELPLDVLTDNEAATLLADWAGQSRQDLLPAAADVIEECGNLPLALAMVGAMVRGKPDRWDNVLHKLRNHDLAQIRRDFPNYPYPSLFRAIEVSVEALEPPSARDRYLDFAVFDRNASIPMAALEAYWEPEGLDKYAVQDVVDVLVDRSLLQRGAGGRLRLHDLQLDFLIKHAGDLAALHGRFLDAYGRRCKPDRFSGPNDGYFFENWTYHLVAAGREGDLHELLRHETAKGRNGWHACQAAIDPSGALYLRDVTRAWAAADAVDAEAADQGCTCPSIALEIQYALAISSMHTHSANIPPALLAALIENHIWTPDQALAAARQTPALEGRADALGAVAALLTGPAGTAIYREALNVLREAIGATDEAWRPKEALLRLVPGLPEAVLDDALRVARAFDNGRDRAQALAAVGGRFPVASRQPVLDEAVAAARAIPLDSGVTGPGVGRASALLEVSGSLAEPLRAQVLQEALAIARDLDGQDSWRARTLADVAVKLAEPLRGDILREALEAAADAAPGQETDGGGWHWTSERAMALSEIAPTLSEPLLDEALAVARDLRAADRDQVLGPLAKRLAEVGAPRKALAAANAIAREHDRAGALADAATHASDATDLEAVLAAAREMGQAHAKSRVAAAVAAALARAGRFDEARAVADSVESSSPRVEVFAALAASLPEHLRGKAVEQAMAAARHDQYQISLASRIGVADEPLLQLALALAKASQFDTAVAAARMFPKQARYGGVGPRAKALTLLAPRLPDKLRAAVLVEAVGAAQVVGDTFQRAWVLAAWSAGNSSQDTPACVRDAFKDALAALSSLVDQESRRTALVHLVPHLPDSLLDAALAVARGIEDAAERAVALVKVAVRLPEPAKSEVMAEAVESVKAVTTVESIVPVLSEVLGDLPESRQRYLLENTLAQDAQIRRGVLPHVCAALPELLQREALAAVEKFEGTDERFRALVALAAVLPESLQRELVGALGTLDDAAAAGRALARAAPHLAEPVLAEALQATNNLEDSTAQATAIAALAPQLARAGRVDDAMTVIGQIDWGINATDGSNLWAGALTATTRCLPASDPPSVAPEVLDRARTIEQSGTRAQVLAAMIPFVEESLRDGIVAAELDKLTEVDPDKERSEVLSALAPRIPERLLPAAVAAALSIADTSYVYVSPRADALAALAARFAGLRRSSLHGLWRDTLHVLASHQREDLLWDLAALSPAALALAGPGVAADTICALGRITRWWP
jgi:hypothetical protein